MKNIIFDFGQVIVHFDEEYMTSRYIKDEAVCQKVRQVVFDRLYWDRFDDGSLTTEAAKPLMAQRLPLEWQQSAFKVLDNWYYDLPFINGIKELLFEIKQSGRRLYLLSNVGLDFAENYKYVPELKELFSLFDGLVFSSVIHKVKPEKAIFEYLLGKYGLQAADCVFIDDRSSNIDGAQTAGIKGILFDGDTAKLRQQLF